MKRRNPMKRIIAAIFAVLMLVSFAACRNSDVPSDDTGNDNAAEEKIEYDYSKIEIHPMVSAGCDLPYDAATLPLRQRPESDCEKSKCAACE